MNLLCRGMDVRLDGIDSMAPCGHLSSRSAPSSFKRPARVCMIASHRALAAQIEERNAAIADAQRNGGKSQQPAAAVAMEADGGLPESVRGGLPKDTPEDLDQLVKEWLAKVCSFQD